MRQHRRLCFDRRNVRFVYLLKKITRLLIHIASGYPELAKRKGVSIYNQALPKYCRRIFLEAG
jgi:hypothetical protein